MIGNKEKEKVFYQGGLIRRSQTHWKGQRIFYDDKFHSENLEEQTLSLSYTNPSSQSALTADLPKAVVILWRGGK